MKVYLSLVIDRYLYANLKLKNIDILGLGEGKGLGCLYNCLRNQEAGLDSGEKKVLFVGSSATVKSLLKQSSNLGQSGFAVRARFARLKVFSSPKQSLPCFLAVLSLPLLFGWFFCGWGLYYVGKKTAEAA